MTQRDTNTVDEQQRCPCCRQKMPDMAIVRGYVRGAHTSHPSPDINALVERVRLAYQLGYQHSISGQPPLSPEEVNRAVDV